MKKELTKKMDDWLREHIPQYGEMRDRAIAAGIIDPALPMTEAQVEAVAEIAGRVRRRLSR
jgi:hypothetical protein